MALTLKDLTLKTILITGGNRGIGLEAVRQMLEKGDSCAAMNVIATARKPDQARELLDLQQKHPNRLYVEELDVASSESRAALQKRLKDTRLDVLINNAGIYSGGKNPVSDATTMMKTNYFGPKNLSKLLQSKSDNPLFVINVSSGMGALSGFSKAAQQKLLDPSLSESQLDEMVEKYCASNSPRMSRATGWPSDPYSASKGALNALTRIFGENQVAVCPGWVRTDMGGSAASRSVSEGADTIVWLATEADPKRVAGKLYRDRREANW